MPSAPHNPREFGRYVALAQVGLEFVAPIGLGLALDYAFGWLPRGTIVGAVIGLIGGVAHLVHLSNRPEHNEPPGRPPQDSS